MWVVYTKAPGKASGGGGRTVRRRPPAATCARARRQDRDRADNEGKSGVKAVLYGWGDLLDGTSGPWRYRTADACAPSISRLMALSSGSLMVSATAYPSPTVFSRPPSLRVRDGDQNEWENPLQRSSYDYLVFPIGRPTPVKVKENTMQLCLQIFLLAN